MFKTETYKNRRARLKQDIREGIVLFPGNEESPMNYPDNPYRFRQDSSFLYFFGLDHPGLFGYIDVDSGKEIIFGDDLTIDDVIWMGTKPSLLERSKPAGINTVLPYCCLQDYVDDAVKKERKIHFLPPYRAENMIMLWNLTGIPPGRINEAASVELIKAVVNQRNYKSQEEIDEIEKAVNITVDMHLAAMKMAKPGVTEAQIAARVHEVALAAGGDISFPIIATIHGETLHNHYHGNRLESGQLFLLDAGAETAMHYAGDMSSTFPVDKTFTGRQKDIYRITLDAHMAAVNMLKPGIDFKDVHLEACRTITNGMKEMGFMKGDVEEAVEQGAHALFFPCGTGHMMGLDVHDMEDLGEVYVGYDGQPKSTQFGLKSLRLGRALEPGFVLTIEPGIYFIPELIGQWKTEGKCKAFINYEKVEEYMDFSGCRNEEDFVITETGARCLGKPLPKTIEEVEAVRG